MGWFVKIELRNGKLVWHSQDSESEAIKYAKFHNGTAVALYAAPVKEAEVGGEWLGGSQPNPFTGGNKLVPPLLLFLKEGGEDE